LQEYQNKAFTKFAFHKCLILKEMFFVEQAGYEPKSQPKKKKREQAPALQTELSTRLSVAWDREKSRKTLRKNESSVNTLCH
jgi:hypothetical protein